MRSSKEKNESKVRDILIEGAIKGLARNLALGKFPGICKMTPAKTPSNRGEGAFPCSQTDEYLKCHYRTFIQQLMETELELKSS